MSKKSSTAKSREQEYLKSIDLLAWWEEFRFSQNSNGTLKFKTVWGFVSKKTKISWQREFLYWLLGPKAEPGKQSKYENFPQHDWDQRRETGLWYSDSNLEHFQKELESKRDALSKLASMGNINAKFLLRLQKIMGEVDKEFAGRMFLPELDLANNERRVQFFLHINKELFGLMRDTQMLYAKMHGVDLDQITEFMMMFGKGMGQAAGLGSMLFANNNADGHYNDAFAKILDMTITKAAKYQIPLPDKDMEKIIVANGGKNKVQ